MCFPVTFAKLLRTLFSQNTSERLLLNTLNKYFIDIVLNLGIIQKYVHITDETDNISHPTEIVIAKYKNHLSISNMNKLVSNVDDNTSFFQHFTRENRFGYI